jgi:hypothetical protein
MNEKTMKQAMEQVMLQAGFLLGCSTLKMEATFSS